MSNTDLARRTKVEIKFGGVDITSSIQPYLLSVSYTDNEEDETDDLQIKLQDRGGIWTHSWLAEAVDKAASGQMTVEMAIVRKNWNSDGGDKVLLSGQFELDSVVSSGPPSTVTIKATSLPFRLDIRQTPKTKAWEKYTLQGIANEIASSHGMSCLYESAIDPLYERVEQYDVTDIYLLSELCHRAGISLKCTNRILVLFDQELYEQRGAILTILNGSDYTKYSLNVGSADTQYSSCRVTYTKPDGTVITGLAKDKKISSEQQLRLNIAVSSTEEAKTVAEKMLKLKNKFQKSATFTFPGNPDLVAGNTVALSGFGGWDGKYMISQATHSVGNGGYTTQIKCRHID